MPRTGRSPRAAQIVECSRRLIEEGHGDEFTMRRLAEELGMRAPSLYKHFPDKESITNALYVDYLTGLAEALEAALAATTDDQAIGRLVRAYRGYSLDNAEVYRFVHYLPYPREQAAEALRRNRRVWLTAAGDSDLAMAVYAFARGMVDMEIHSLYPLGLSPEPAYEIGVDAFVRNAQRLGA